MLSKVISVRNEDWNALLISILLGRGSGTTADSQDCSSLPERSINRMAMVRQTPGSQLSSRPSWSMLPASTTPSDMDDTPASTGNLHGAIGEHRRCSRSSSVSSGGSSTNSGDGTDAVHQHSSSRIPPQPPAGSREMAADSLNGCGQIADLRIDAADILTGRNGQLAAPEFEPRLIREFTDQAGGRMAGSSESSPFGYFMGVQPPPDASKPGRPITGPNSSSPFSSVRPNADLERLLREPVFCSNNLAASITEDLKQVGGSAYLDYTNNPANASALSATDIGFINSGFQSSSSSLDSGAGKYQQGFRRSNSQFSQNTFMGTNTSGGGGDRDGAMHYSQSTAVAPSFNTATGYYSSSRQGGGDYFSAPGNFQAFSSQDFSMPPPVQPWSAGGHAVAADSLQARITCKLCNKRYKWPHALECLHVYCFMCMNSKYDPHEKCITCPSCDFKTMLKNGPCSLKLDYQGAKFMREMKVSPFSCTACTRDMEAVTCCTSCQAFLCSECRDGHKNMNQFQSHILAPITKIGRMNNGEFVTFCDNHPMEPMTKYCCVCQFMVCAMCIPDHTHPDYPASSSCSVEEVYPIVVERLNTWNEDADIKHKDLKEITKHPPMSGQFLDSKRRSCRKQIDEYTDYCKTVADQNRLAAYDLLEKTLAQMEMDAQNWTDSANKVKTELEAVTTFNTRTVQTGSVSDCMSLLELMENGYKRAIENFSRVVKNNESIKFDLKFGPNYKESHAVLNQNFLSISYTINGAEQKVSPTLGNQKSEAGRGRSFTEYAPPSTENPDCNYQRWSLAQESMSISTWNNVNDRDRKSGTFIPHLNRCRTKTSYVHLFGEFGRGEYAFTEPSGQAYLKDGSYVICDTNNHRIVYFSANHEYIRTIGQPPNLPPLVEEQEQRANGLRGKGFARQDGYLYFPNRVAVCPITQNIIATERPPSHDVQIFTATGEFVRCFGGSILQHPRGVTVDEEGIIIVVECKVMKLVMFSQDGSFIVSHSLTKDLEFPNDVAAKDHKIFISDNRGHCVQVFNYNAEFLYKIGNESITYFPIGVSINHLNQVVVTDNHNTFNITVFDMNGAVLHIFESVSKLAQCHNVAVNPTCLELMLTTKDCSVYFFNYDPDIMHSLTPPISRGPGYTGMGGAPVSRRPRIGSTGTFY